MDDAVLRKLLTKIQKSRIAVLGDFCLDAYWELDMSASEISVETGLPTWPVKSQRYTLGGAGNIVANLTDLGVRNIHIFGVLAEDLFSKIIMNLFHEKDINTDTLCIQKENWDSHVFIKPLQNQKEINRIDFGNFNILSKRTADKIINHMENSLNLFDLLIINQQVISGIHTSKYFRNCLKKFIAKHREKIFIVDSRKYSNEYPGTIRKINEHEMLAQCGYELNLGNHTSEKNIIKCMKKLCKEWKKLFIVTRGSESTLICDHGKITSIPTVYIDGEIDPVGAGDSFISAVSSALAIGTEPALSVELANLAAAVTVKKLYQTGTATPEEIIALNRKSKNSKFL